MPSTTYTTDNYTYTTNWNNDVVMSLTLGDRTFSRVQILNILAWKTPPSFFDYPYKEKDIGTIVTALCLARLDGAL